MRCIDCGLELTANTIGDIEDAHGIVRRCHWCEANDAPGADDRADLIAWGIERGDESAEVRR